jgi:fluoroquinolone resistance protein
MGKSNYDPSGAMDFMFDVKNKEDLYQNHYSNFLIDGVALCSTSIIGGAVSDALFSKIDFRKTKFRNIRFSDVKFEDCDLRDCELFSCDFIKCDFIDCVLDSAKLTFCEFPGTIFSTGTEIYGAEFDTCTFVGTDFLDSSLEFCIFDKTKFSDVEMSDTSLENVVMSNSTLDGQCRIISCNVSFAQFDEDFKRAKFTNPHISPFEHENRKVDTSKILSIIPPNNKSIVVQTYEKIAYLYCSNLDELVSPKV